MNATRWCGRLAPGLLSLAILAPPARGDDEDDLRTARCQAALGQALIDLGEWAAAESHLRDCLATRRRREPKAWITPHTASLLGWSLVGQKKYAEAEPLLLAGYEGMYAREKTIPPEGKVRLPEAAERLIELYTATNKPDEVKKWQAERAKYPGPKPPEKP